MVLASIEIILVAFPGNATIVDSMYRTIVIASQTTGTLSVMEPTGRCTCYIINRTHALTLATSGTNVNIDGEFLVGNHVFVKVLADDVGKQSGCCSLVELLDATFAFFDDAGYVFCLLASLFYLLAFTTFGVGIHKG